MIQKRKIIILPIAVGYLLASSNGAVEKENRNGQYNTATEKYFTVAKLYGYIKYFYPGDEAASIDWDRFAFYSAKMAGESSTQNFPATLNTIFLPVAPAIRIHESGQSQKIDKEQNPDPSLKPVYWQHLGDGKGSAGHPYKSIRINRPSRKLPGSSNDFGAIRKWVNLDEVRGKTIRLSGKIYASPSFVGTPSLFILVKEKNKDRVDYSTQGQAILAAEWSNHSITANIPDSIEQVGIVAQGITLAGSLRFDDLLVEIEENGNWKVSENLNFNNYTNEQFTSAWRSRADNQDITLDSNGNNKYVTFSRTKGAYENMLPLFDKSPLPSETLIKNIGSGLQLTFPLVLMSDQHRTFPVPDEQSYKTLLDKLNQIPDSELAVTNLYTRIANVIILWNKIQHFHQDNPFTTAEWEVYLRNALARCITDNTLDEHRKTLSLMLSGLKDSHMTLYYSSLVRQPYYPPVNWELVEDQLVITQVFDSSLSIQPGDIVDRINNIPAKEYWADIKKSVIGATESRKDFKAIDESLSGIKGTTLSIKIKPANPNSQSREILLVRILSDFQYNKALTASRKYQKYQQLDAGIYYVNLEEITWTDLQSHIDELATAKGIIFDGRGYPKWQTIDIVAHFIKEPVCQVKYATPRIIYPDRYKIDFSFSPVDTIQPKQPYIGAKKIFITNGKAISYAEDFLNLVSYYKLATVIGEPTAGTTGTVNMSFLFGGLSTPWTGMRVIRQDGTLFNGKGVLPDKIVKRSNSSVKTGKDDCIEYALKNILKQ